MEGVYTRMAGGSWPRLDLNAQTQDTLASSSVRRHGLCNSILEPGVCSKLGCCRLLCDAIDVVLDKGALSCQGDMTA
jgi:hypothetical protein